MVMDIRVLTPDRVICSTTANEVILPGLTGQVGVLDGHTALITALDTGLLRIKLDEKWTPIILCGGLAEIDQNRVTVLVNDVEELTNVKLSEATKELEKATLAVETAETSKDRLDASVELKKANARLEAINYYNYNFKTSLNKLYNNYILFHSL
jgi:F-type H+-transporting ATPase subunit epsilon